jgi:hypothetical protein
MKNLKKMSRNDLKTVNGGKIYPGTGGGGDCGNSCSPGDGRCEAYGLSCGMYAIYHDGVLTSSCWKCM